MNIIEQLQTFWLSLQKELPILQNIYALVASVFITVPAAYLTIRKIMKPSNTASQQSNSHPRPQEKAIPTELELIQNILLHLLIQQVKDPYIFEYSDMPKKYTVQEITRHLHYCITKGYIEGSIDEKNQMATLEITQLGHYMTQSIPPSKYL